MKYHYEYELKTNNLCYGCLSKGLFKTYASAYNEMRILQNKYGAMDIYKVRVYDDKN